MTDPRPLLWKIGSLHHHQIQSGTKSIQLSAAVNDVTSSGYFQMLKSLPILETEILLDLTINVSNTPSFSKGASLVSPFCFGQAVTTRRSLIAVCGLSEVVLSVYNLSPSVFNFPVPVICPTLFLIALFKNSSILCPRESVQYKAPMAWRGYVLR